MLCKNCKGISFTVLAWHSRMTGLSGKSCQVLTSLHFGSSRTPAVSRVEWVLRDATYAHQMNLPAMAGGTGGTGFGLYEQGLRATLFCPPLSSLCPYGSCLWYLGYYRSLLTWECTEKAYKRFFGMQSLTFLNGLSPWIYIHCKVIYFGMIWSCVGKCWKKQAIYPFWQSFHCSEYLYDQRIGTY